jgi:exodeoxyribonuclease VII large subunit
MERGYSLTYAEDGRLIKSAADVQVEEKVTVRLADGTLICEVVDKGE